jgi:tRNA threonylcarbamoyladenosine dehydratase
LTALVESLSGQAQSVDLNRRFGGLERLYGVAGARRIREAHIAVVGIGGVGSWAAEALARSGVGRLTLVDLDHVSESNVNRQIHALTQTLGQAKVLAMKARIAQINPDCQVVAIEEFVTPQNWPQLLQTGADFSGRRVAEDGTGFDAVIDACDQVNAKVAMAAWALQNKSNFVSVGAAGGKRLAHYVDIGDLSQTTHDPLMALVRNRLRKEHGAPREGKRIGIDCVFSREAVRPPDPSCALEGDGSLNCHGYGSVVSVTATFGQCAAGWVLEKISAAI